MVNEVRVEIYKLVKTGNISNYDLVGSIDAEINQVDNTQLSLYPDLPVGSGYEIIFRNFFYNYLPLAGDKVVIVDKYNSQFNNNDTFIFYTNTQKQKMLDNIIIRGIVILQ